MKGKTKAVIIIATVLAILLVGPHYLKNVFAQEYVTGTQDDTFGVWLFNAGNDTHAGGAPTADIIERAIDYNIFAYIGDSPEEVYDFGWGWVEPTTGQEDKTIGEVIQGLSAIDDFGMIANPGDDAANFDTGRDGYFLGGFDPDDLYVIVSDGILATGVLGPSGATSAVEAEEAIDGYEIFIFEDAELSGMIVTLSNSLGLTITFTIEDLQVNPSTPNGADDTLVAIDLDALPGFDDTFIDTIRIEDDGITSSSTYGDTTLEIDAIATRKIERCVEDRPNPQRLWTTDINGLEEIDEFSIGTPVYLKTADDFAGFPLQPGKYRIYLFEGNIIPENGDVIANYGTSLGLTPLEVTTTSDGRFGAVVGDWATPVLMWDIPNNPTLICNDYTIILDQIEVGVGPDAMPALNIGVWGDPQDYRDDLCTATPTPPSFHVIPEVALGTILVLASMFGSLGIYVARKKKYQNLK